MIEHTVERALKFGGENRTITVVGTGHRQYLKNLNIKGRIIEQPVSRGTGAGVYLAITYILAQDPEARILIFPSDHFICPRSVFLEQVESALQLVEEWPDKMVLLGAHPEIPETDYGWIEPGPQLTQQQIPNSTAREVASFHEKPSKKDAAKWLSLGYLWNTMIVAATVNFFWTKGSQNLPGNFIHFESFLLRLRSNLRAGISKHSVLTLFRNIPNFDFSKTLLTRVSGESIVLPLEKILWSDWGRPERVFSTLRKIGREPRFLPTNHYQGAAC
jgi:mannose-1-phosphate guanylyltransferase